MKYALVVFRPSAVPRVLGYKDIGLTGLFQWLKVFNGQTISIDELDPCSLEYYDVLHVNTTSHQASLVSDIRKMLGTSSSTKLISNFDYAVEMIPNYFSNKKYTFGQALKSLSEADLVFSVEPTQRALLEHFLKKEIPLIQHPCDTEFVRSYTTKKWERNGKTAVIYHREDMNTLFPYVTTDDNGMDADLLGFLQESEDFLQYGRFSEVHERMPNPDFLKLLSEFSIALEPYVMHSVGRFSMDTACLRIPTVGSDLVFSMRHCWPTLCCDPFAFEAQREKIRYIMSHDKAHDEACEYAAEKVEDFNLKNSKRKLLEAMEES